MTNPAMRAPVTDALTVPRRVPSPIAYFLFFLIPNLKFSFPHDRFRNFSI